MSWKKLFLVISQILGLLVNTLTASYEYSRSNSENLPLPIQTQLSEKPKSFFGIFIAFLESRLNFEDFEKKNEPHSLSISEVIDCERRAYLNKYVKGLVSESPLAVNVLTKFSFNYFEVWLALSFFCFFVVESYLLPLIFKNEISLTLQASSEAYSESCQTSKIEDFAKIVNNFSLFIIFVKSSILEI